MEGEAETEESYDIAVTAVFVDGERTDDRMLDATIYGFVNSFYLYQIFDFVCGIFVGFAFYRISLTV